MSLAKNGHLKPAPTEHAGNTTQPVFDASLKDDSEEDFEDKEMENESENDQTLSGEKTNEQVDDLTGDEGKQEGQQEDVEGSQMNGGKIQEAKTKEVPDGKVENFQMDGRIMSENVDNQLPDRGKVM